MPRCRVVRPEVVRLSLSDGDWIDVIKELNAGEYFDLIEAMAARKPFSKLVAYVLGWSLLGLDDQPLPYGIEIAEDDRRATIRALDKGTLRELFAALDKHETAEEAALDAKKKMTGTAPESSQTLRFVAS